jgi:hypothetical protein
VLGWLVQVYFGARLPSLEARTPGNIVDALDSANSGGLANDTLAAGIAELGAIVLPGSPADFANLTAAETKNWACLIKVAGLKRD